MNDDFNRLLEEFYDSSLFGFDETTGQIIPQTSSVKSAIISMLQTIFNQSLRLDDETIGGRLVEAWTMMVTRFCAVTATYANQINPHYATGQLLDALGALFSVERLGATRTQINIKVFGRANVVVPSGSLISDNSDNEFSVDDDIVILAGGNASGTATCTKSGVVVVETGTVTNILSSISGWMGVSNTGIVRNGTEMESDEGLRKRIVKARWTGTAFVEAMRAEIERIGNIDAFVVDNCEHNDMYLKSDMTLVDTEPSPEEHYIKLSAHSICAIVYGASDEQSREVAKAIYTTKSAGCGYTRLDAASQGGTTKGNVVEKTVMDDSNGMVYTVTYNTPIETRFAVKVEVGKNSYMGTDAELIADVKGAIRKWSVGETPFVDGIAIGQSLYSFEIGAAISDVIPSIQIKNCQIKIDLDDSSESGDGAALVQSVELFINEIGVLDETEIEVIIS